MILWGSDTVTVKLDQSKFSMNKLKVILGASILLFVSAQANAAIIDATSTNTEYAPGLNADLQGE